MANVLVTSASAGFDEKQDVLVTATAGEPGSGISIHLQSKVMRQYGTHIKELIKNTVANAGFEDVVLDVKDNGAWDYTLAARVESALERGMNHAE
ncbi:citrate lyase acyl carrier protein [Megasphaera paucivorans]|uniref:Citrate lyase subunit gamma (Acyl carrier protein) n=1 Tax=Megasphaera paucivorans TaxID=349095 RepID=A0A1G9U1E9_9FIRM|nr:citrate lyase acyl carrier protein [Megasphaera paucivorans]SDM53681.1 citrate lyase subunit gamma (acyl carrier protein) [Megasphaera paucivorans]